MVAVAGILIGGIARGAGPQCVVVRERLPGDYEPFLGSGAFALDLRLHPAPDHLDLYRPFLTVSHRQVRPRLRIEALSPLRHRLRSEEHTSELQSQSNLVCRLLLE